MMLIETAADGIDRDSPRAAIRFSAVLMKKSSSLTGCAYLPAAPARAAKPPSTILLADVTIQPSQR